MNQCTIVYGYITFFKFTHHWWTFDSLLLFGNCKYYHFEHSCASFCVNISSCLLDINLGVESLGHMVTVFNVLRNGQTFKHVCYILHSQCMKVPVSSQFSYNLLLSDFFIICMFVGITQISHGLDLHFPDD